MSDSMYSPEAAASRPSIEVPTLNDELLQIFLRSGPATTIPVGQRKAVISEATSVVLDELKLCEETSEKPTSLFNEAVLSILKISMYSPYVTEGLKRLYWSGRIQKAILDTFMYLCNVGLLDKACLKEPFSLMSESEQVGRLTEVLCCFERPYRNGSIDAGFGPHYDLWRTAEAWLATMILRSTPNGVETLDAIEATGLLGPINESQLDEWKQWNSDLRLLRNPTENVGIQGQANEFGFWLPHGLGTTPNAFEAGFQAHLNRFNRIERAFKAYFDVPDEQMVLGSRPGTSNDTKAIEILRRILAAHPNSSTTGVNISTSVPSPALRERLTVISTVSKDIAVFSFGPTSNFQIELHTLWEER